MPKFRVKIPSALIVEGENRKQVYESILQQIKDEPETLKDIFEVYDEDSYEFRYDKITLVGDGDTNITCWVDNEQGSAGMTVDYTEDRFGFKSDLVYLKKDKYSKEGYTLSTAPYIGAQEFDTQSYDATEWANEVSKRGKMPDIGTIFSLENTIIHSLDAMEVSTLHQFSLKITPEDLKESMVEMGGDYMCTLELPRGLSSAFGSRTAQPLNLREKGYLQIFYDGIDHIFSYALTYGDNYIEDNKYFENSPLEKTFLQTIDMFQSKDNCLNY